MGIQGLSKVIADHAPKAMQEHAINNYFGRKVAIDASTSIYQFLIAVRAMDNGSTGAAPNAGVATNLTNAAGETTRYTLFIKRFSHIMGMFYRTIRMMDNGIKPLYVFDGKPPELKGKELSKRNEKRKEAVAQMDKAQEVGDMAMVDKMSRRNVKVTSKHNDDCKRLLDLMGVPWIQAPGEAEAECAALVQQGVVYAAGSEDMDTLTFGTNVLLRHLTFSEAKKMPICEIHLDKVLAGLEMTMSQFIDMCILLGCDYCDTIKGIGPMRAVNLIKQHGGIEGVIASLDSEKYPVPEYWPYDQVRALFHTPNVLPADHPDVLAIRWGMPDEVGLVDYMVRVNGFSEARVRSAIEKILKAKRTAPQGRLDSYFKSVPVEAENKKPTEKGTKTADRKKPVPAKGKLGPVKKAAK